MACKSIFFPGFLVAIVPFAMKLTYKETLFISLKVSTLHIQQGINYNFPHFNFRGNEKKQIPGKTLKLALWTYIISIQHEKQFRPTFKLSWFHLLPSTYSLHLNLLKVWFHYCSWNGKVSHQCTHYITLLAISHLTPTGRSCQELITHKHDTSRAYYYMHTISF